MQTDAGPTKRQLSDDELKYFLLQVGWFYKEKESYGDKFSFDLIPKLEYIDAALKTITEDKIGANILYEENRIGRKWYTAYSRNRSKSDTDLPKLVVTADYLLSSPLSLQYLILFEVIPMGKIAVTPYGMLCERVEIVRHAIELQFFIERHYFTGRYILSDTYASEFVEKFNKGTPLEELQRIYDIGALIKDLCNKSSNLKINLNKEDHREYIEIYNRHQLPSRWYIEWANLSYDGCYGDLSQIVRLYCREFDCKKGNCYLPDIRCRNVECVIRMDKLKPYDIDELIKTLLFTKNSKDRYVWEPIKDNLIERYQYILAAILEKRKLFCDFRVFYQFRDHLDTFVIPPELHYLLDPELVEFCKMDLDYPERGNTALFMVPIDSVDLSLDEFDTDEICKSNRTLGQKNPLDAQMVKKLNNLRDKFDFEIVENKTVWDVESIRAVGKKSVDVPTITLFDVLAWQSEESYYYCDEYTSNTVLAILLYRNPCKLLNSFINLFFDWYRNEDNAKVKIFKQSKLLNTILKTKRLKYVLRADFLSDNDFIESIVRCQRVINKRGVPKIKPKGNFIGGLLVVPWRDYFVASIDYLEESHITLLHGCHIPKQPYLIFIKLKYINLNLEDALKRLYELCSFSFYKTESDQIKEFLKIRKLYDHREYILEENWTFDFIRLIKEEANESKQENSEDKNSEDKNSEDKNSKDENSKDENSKDENSKDENSKELTTEEFEDFNDIDTEEDYITMQVMHMIHIIKYWPDSQKEVLFGYLPDIKSKNPKIVKSFEYFFRCDIESLPWNRLPRTIHLAEMSLGFYLENFAPEATLFRCDMLDRIMCYHPDFRDGDDKLSEEEKNKIAQNKTLLFELVRQFIS